jgi:3D (Asp-Asp-Asp) domain-containing protein
MVISRYAPLEQQVIDSPSVKMENKLVITKKAELIKEFKVEKMKVSKIEENKQQPPVIKTEKKQKDINIIVTFYTNSISDCQSTKGISASGKDLVSASRGGDITYVAAPKNIPFNTKIDVKGIGVCDVQDRGGAIKHVWIDNVEYMKLDVFVKGATRQQLLNKGLVKTTGHIIE